MCALLLAIVSALADGGESPPLEPAPPPPIRRDEPRKEVFSLEAAARALDSASLEWQRTRKCASCHTNFAYLVARPALAPVLPARPEVRRFIEEMVEVRWEKEGPRWDAEVVCAAVCLALNDRRTGGKLHPLTRKALGRMASLQRPDGGWEWLKCGWPPMESDDHYGAAFAALGVALAPEGYAGTEEGARVLEGIRRYLRANPPPSLHHRAMLAWASLHAEGILSAEERQAVAGDLWKLQRSDGGWATATLLDGWKEHRRQDSLPQETERGDGYGTGFTVHLLSLLGTPRDDPRLQRALRWLRENQRESGRWFTPSPTKDSRHFLTNAGTAFAALALEACGEVGAGAR